MNKAALRSKTCSMLLALLAAVALAGCAVGPTKEDPYEPFNRAMFSVHETVDDAVIKPVAQGYVAVIPEPIRTGVSNFFGNIDDLFSGINSLLQGNGNRAGDAFGRVLLNSSFGVGGIFDLASMMGITKDRNDFGITFGKWGFPQGPYLFIPALGPTTVRDGSGWVVRGFASPIGFLNDVPLRNSLWGLGYVDTRQQALAAESVVETAAIDKYRFIRNAYLRSRRYQLYDGHPPPEEDEDNAPTPGAAAPAPATQPPASTAAPPPIK
jgi:phospholipid-binding lipoprotein MlaA